MDATLARRFDQESDAAWRNRTMTQVRRSLRRYGERFATAWLDNSEVIMDVLTACAQDTPQCADARLRAQLALGQALGLPSSMRLFACLQRTNVSRCDNAHLDLREALAAELQPVLAQLEPPTASEQRAQRRCGLMGEYSVASVDTKAFRCFAECAYPGEMMAWRACASVDTQCQREMAALHNSYTAFLLRVTVAEAIPLLQ